MEVPVGKMLALVIAVVAAGCSGDSSPSGGDFGGWREVPCAGTYGGAVAGAFDCVASALRNPYLSSVRVSFVISNLTGTALDLDLNKFTWDGALTDEVRSQASAGVSLLATVIGGSQASPTAYVASKNNYGFADVGTGELSITSHALTASDAYSETYGIHGSYTLTAPIYPASGVDPVTLSVTF
jgi:hypothetical protein